MSTLLTGSLQGTTEYGPFTKLVNVYGLKILGLGTIGGQPDVQDEFLRKTAQTFKLLLNPDAAGIDQGARAKALEGLTSYNVIQRVGVGSYDSYSPSLDSGAYSGWDQVNDANEATDFIWHLRDSNGSYSPSGTEQTTELLEHALHTLSQYAFPSAFPEQLNVFSSNGRANGISGGLKDAYDEAIRNGVYDPSDYAGADDGSDAYGQMLLREYVYCLIYAEWGYTSSLTEDGTLAPEWSDAHLSTAAIARDNPLGHKLFTDNISKIISKPSLESLQSIFKDGDAGVSGYVPSNSEPTPTLEETSDPGDDIDQINSISDITKPDKITTFKLRQSIAIGNQDIDTLMAGTNKKDKIIGSPEGEVLAGGFGKDVLKGGGGADGFLFNQLSEYGKKKADKINDFNPEEGDSILVDNDVFDLSNKIKLKVVAGKKASKKAAKSINDFIYDDKKGLLYFNENGESKGWGDGGLFAKLQGAPELGAFDFIIF